MQGKITDQLVDASFVNIFPYALQKKHNYALNFRKNQMHECYILKIVRQSQHLVNDSYAKNNVQFILRDLT